MNLTIPGYQTGEIIKQSATSVVYQGVRDNDQQAVVIKTLRDEYPTREQIARVWHEYSIHQKLNEIQGVAKIYDLIKIDNKPALVIEYISGGEILILLEQHKHNQDFLNRFFELAIQLTQTIGEIHQQHIIHKDLNPRNILLDPDSETIKIIDFGIATELSREKQNHNFEQLKGSLPYISPEQTGRMNRSIDYRSDFYSLGIIFYKLLSGKLPYEAEQDNPMSWIHCHIAREPKPLIIADKSVSTALSTLINKLMAKNAEDRYQSAFGLKNDLEVCYKQWQKYGVIGEFNPGQQDISDHFQIQQKLYGREKEVSKLMRAFSDITEGDNKMFLVSGFSGIGKSALINELHKPIVAKQGYFIRGKFDQFQRNIPYSAVANAFCGLMKQLLTESQEKLLVWKHQLLEVLGTNGQVIIDFVPELEQIIGVQPKVPHLGTEENQNRFNRLAIQFLQLFTRKEHPLVMFIDDLQWVDSASLDLLKLFMLSKEHSHFLFIGAYRNNEVDEHHPFIAAVDELKNAKVSVSDLVLKPLKLEHTNTLISESLSAKAEDTVALAQLVMNKTAGNPFFINQFLKQLYETGLLSFQIKERSWQWDLKRINQQQISDNVVDLVVSKIQRLPDQMRDLLMLGACIGNAFDLQTLSIISEQTLVETAKNLWPAVKSGLLLTEGDGHALLKGLQNSESFDERDYPIVSERFPHDRIQQAAYSLIKEDQKKQIHLRIARLLLKKIPKQELDNYYFEIVGHYNKSIDLLINDIERCHLAELNLKMGKKAQGATAYSPALQFFDQAALCLEPIKIPRLDKLHFEIDKGRIECHLLLSQITQGLELSEQLLKRANTIEDKVELNNILILYYGGAGQMDKSIDIALDSLRYFDINLPRNPNQAQLLLELAKAKFNLGSKNNNDLMQLPFVQDKNIHIVFSLLKELIAPTYLQGLTNLLPFIILRMFNLTLKHGNGPVSAFTYSAYALLWAKLDDFKEAYRFGVLAMEFNKKIDNPPMEARCYFMATSFALYWKQPLIDLQQPRKTGLQKLIDTGEYFWGSYIYLFGFWQEVVLSKSLDDLVAMTEREIKFSQKAKQIEPYYVHTLHRNLLKNLAGLTLNSDVLDLEEEGEEQEALAFFERNKTSTMGKFYHVVCRLLMHYHLEQYQQAIDIATRPDMTEDVIRDGTYTRVIYTFFTCLAILAQASPSNKPIDINKLYKKRKQKMEQWFTLFSENFSSMWYLILAEEARVQDQDNQAIDFFEQALSSAKQNQSFFLESLVNELYAKFWLKRNNQKVAAVFMAEAGYLYYRWGATGKQAFLHKQYTSLFDQHNAGSTFAQTLQEEESNTDTHSTGKKESALDLNTLVKASQILSSEIVMEKLLQKLMHFLIENAGAQKGVVILNQQDELFIVTDCMIEKEHVNINQQTIALDESHTLPRDIVHYVARSKELLVLDDATNNNQFASDTYIKTNRIKSILCMPLLDGDKLTGIVYLENNLANNSFTPGHVETLQVLSAAIVISLQNAQLYQNLEEYNQTLEEKVKERTTVLRSVNEVLQTRNSEVQESNKIIEEKNSNITKSIIYAQRMQQAMLPQDQQIAEQLPDFFSIFKPKEIVSGDFYWFNKVQDKRFLIVADCTGHGVPGAFLSVIGHTLLNKIIIEKLIFSPALILEALHKEVRTSLRQKGKKRQANDGMDIAICQIDLSDQSLIFAGAKRPLYLYQNNTSHLIKIVGDKKSIGGRQKEQERHFTDHQVKFSSGDTLYMNSDGFVDQQNAEGKKFGSLKLESLLQQVAGLDAASQKQHINEALDKHQENESQRDDITLIGVKFNCDDSKNTTNSQEKL